MDAVRPVAKPAGGFRFVTVQQWCQLWSAYRTRQLRLSDVRVWCALQEALARRCLLPAGHPLQITAAELRDLVGPRVPIRPALARLQAAALVRQQQGGLTVPDNSPDHLLSAEVTTMLQHIPTSRRRIPVPRRVLRYLARCSRRTRIATVLGHLVRCLYYRRGQCQPIGFCAASWIATVFGLSLRSVKTARQHLEHLGLLQRLDTPHWVRTRYGEKIAVNLQWEGLSHRRAAAQDAPGAADARSTHALAVASRAAVTSAGTSSTRLPVGSRSDPAPPSAGANHRRSTSPFAPPHLEGAQMVAPPESHRKLSARTTHQEPAAGRPAGRLFTLVNEARAALRAGTHLPARTASASPRRLVRPLSSPPPVHRRPSPAVRHATSPSRPIAAAASTARRSGNAPPLHPVPTLRHITRHDLRDTRRVLQLYEQAVRAGLITQSEADRLTVVALAQHVLAQQPANPGGLFWRLLTTRQFSFITQAEEDIAQQRLKTILYGDPRDDWRR